MSLFLVKMREHLLFCILITLLSGNIADIFPFYDDTLTQNEDASLYDDPRDYRLPTDIKPLSYEIMLIPNLNDDTFKGMEKIEIEAVRETKSITLHVGNLEIETVNVLIIYELSTNQELSTLTSYDNITEKYTITTSKMLGTPTTKKAVISFTYNGILSDSMTGFYKSSYFDENGEIKWLAATQFQTTHARHAFPCFDEPSFKAKFTIRVARDNNYGTLSNMPLLDSEVLQPGLKTWDIYEQSIPMSTYLVAFMMSEFDSVQSEQPGLNFTVWSKSSTINQTKYALDIGPQVLEIFKTKFSEDYPLAKMDMVAVPDFAAGAMENWGLVTYRESRILYDELESSLKAKQSVASVVAHELAHMWFGNLITPEWWSYLWLSEGFGRYYQYFGVAELESTSGMDEQFVVEQHQSALIADALDTSLPMTRDVVDKSQIAGIGDTITYNKGASIIRMISLIFGTQIFEDSLRSYIQNNKEEGLGRPDALWKAIQEQVDKESVDPRLKVNIKTVMDTWTTQPGYPLLNVTIKDKNVIRFTQERFLLRNLEEVSTNAIWSVPITFITQSNPNFADMAPKYWMFSQESTASYDVDPNEWVILNVQSSGFYRVNYDKLGWKNILDSLTNGNLDDIPVLNRAGIVDDLLNVARIGYQNYDMVFEGLLSYLKKETNYLPFKAARNGFEYINNRFTGRPAHFLYKVYIQNLVEPIHNQLGYEDNEDDDDTFTVLLRHEVNNWLCSTDDSECVTTYTEKFKQWKENGIPIKPNERTTAYCVAIRHGTFEDWEFLWEEYYKSNYPSDQTVILNALGCSQNTTILEQYLGYAITDYETNRIRKHDSTNVFAAVYNSGLLGAEYVLDFVDKYYKEMENYYRGQSTIATILDGASQRLSTYELVDKFEKLIHDRIEDFASINTALNYSLKVAKSELEWYDSYSSYMISWLEEFDRKAFRLPTDIRPESYFLSIAPNFLHNDYTVDGKVSIKAKVENSTDRIVLHSSGIKHDKTVITANGQNVPILKEKAKDRYDFYVIYFNQTLDVETKLVIDIKYTSYLNASELKGFFKSSYMNEKGETRWLAASHLEPVGARRMFPCFDEPAKKAKFTIQVSVLPDYKATVSNMDWKSITKYNGRKIYTFFESKEMSTYLVAVIVSDFKRKSIKVNETTFAVYARPNAINQTDYALSVIHPLVNFFEETYKQEYPINKLFMAALPDFSSGAMENWGLLTYKESNMLYDENHSPITNKQDITNVIAHEISHQWFGNLVSPVWWKYLWLNEGFARYFEYHAPARVFEDKNALESQFVVDEVHSAFRADSFKSTHPLSHDVFTPDQIKDLFDTITYAKGASILRMVEKTFGTELFNNALIHYLENHKYNSVKSEDLYESLQLEINKTKLKVDIKAILNTWTTQSGYPIVNVRITNESIIMEQERFFFEKHESDFDDTIWHIPITWTSVENSSDYNNTTPKFWLKDKTNSIDISSESLLIFNTQQSGYYRVNYEPEHWEKLIDHLRHQTINEINRAALIDDLMNLARANYISYKIAIDATLYLKEENSYIPWRAFFNNLPYLNNRFAGREIEGIYKKWLTSLIEPLYARLGFEDQTDDDNLTMMLRIHTRKWACELEIADCKYYAAKYFERKLHSGIVPPNYRDVVYCTAMRMDKTNNSYKFLWNEYLNSNVTTDKLVILKSLACSENEDVLETLLKEAVADNSYIRYHDSAKVFSNVYDASLTGIKVVMKVIEKNYDDILRRHYGDYTKIANMVEALASRLSRELYNDQFEKFLDSLVKIESEFEKLKNSYLATAKREFNWYDRKAPEIFEVLDNFYSSDTYRLPQNLQPKQYDLDLYNINFEPNKKEGTFAGKVEIQMDVLEESLSIILNSHKLDISNITITRGGTKISSKNYKENNILQQLKIYLSPPAYKDEVIKAEINFEGILNDDMKGFYRSSYFNSNGVKRWLATTQFEPTYARQAFPCFDEPGFKSKFNINIQRKSNYNSLSNMPPCPENKHPENDDYEWDKFYISDVNMSTYLVAFVVSDFKPAVNSENLTLNVWGRPEVAAHGKYAQDIGVKIIRALENITDIKYALPKLDLIGIPDFSMGAMENWGLATFREYGLFYDDKETTSAREKYIITVIAHELSHMWFGNLVTCEWWDYIWLNEGFAEYFESFISDQILPKYKFMDQFVVYELQSAMSKDATISAHPMTHPVQTPEEIANIFDYVSYVKSASFLRMMFNAFDQEAVTSALRDYLKKQSYSTARPTDLWESFQPLVWIPIGNRNASVEEVMNTWTDQPGYPVVHATLANTKLTLTQERFLINRDTSGHEFYWIPVDVFVSSDLIDIPSERKVWLGPEPQTMYINPNNNWFIVNYKQTGFYRVNYDTASWEALINKLKDKGFEAIHVLNRAQIMDDLFNLARANYVDYELLMDALMYLKQETNHLPWKAFFNGLSYIHDRFQQKSSQKDLNEYVLDLLSNMYDKLGFNDNDGDDHLDKLNREMILQWACKLNKEDCIKVSVDLFATWRANNLNQIPRNARPAVYCTAIKEGSSDDWEFLLTQYGLSSFATEKMTIINALGCSTDETVLQNYLGKTMEKYTSNYAIRRQDVSAVFTSVYSAGPVGVKATINFLIKNVKALNQYFGTSETASLIANMASHISTEDEYNLLTEFVTKNIGLFPPESKLRLLSALHTAEINLFWFSSNSYKISEWIMKLKPDIQPSGSTKIESLNNILTTLIALISYLLSHF